MAILDLETGRFSLQIVYDGAPLSGKTSSIVALGRLLECPVVTPGEDRGRTVYFDWMDYVGGICRGKPIQCRVISVPGQDEWASRREAILKAADAVLFVVDSSAELFESSRRRFEDLVAYLKKRKKQIPILLQLNKRDAADALPVEVVLESLDPALDYVETVALHGDGVREAFVMLVGASIRHLRDSELFYGQSSFETQEMQLPDPEQLLELLEQA